MGQIKVQTQNTNNVWDDKKRYNVNSVVRHNGIDYQNVTGKNTNPELLNDWIVIFNDNTPFISKTTTEINAIVSPQNGETYFNTTLATICFYDGTQWKKASHSNM